MALNGAPTNPHFGWYYNTGTSMGLNKLALLASHGWTGVLKHYRWNDLESTKGVYNFQLILDDLATLAPYSLQLCVKIKKQGNPAYNTVLPEYISTDPIYGYCNNARYGHWTRSNRDRSLPITWNAEVVARFVALANAFGAVFNNEPGFELLICWETSVGVPEPNPPGTCDYTINSRKLGEEEYMLAFKDALPDKGVGWPVNWCPWGCDNTFDYCLANGIALTFPDTIIAEPAVHETYDILKPWRNMLMSCPQLQYPNYAKFDSINGGVQTPENMIRYLLNKCDPWYYIIEGREPYFSQGGQALQDLYAPIHTNVKTVIEVVDMMQAEGWDMGHGYDGIEPPIPVPGTAFVTASNTPIREDSGEDAYFNIGCDGCTGSEQIAFEITGDAVEGTHYTKDKISPVSPGERIKITPINILEQGPDVYVTCTVLPGTGYDTRNPVSATIRIVNAEGQPPVTEPVIKVEITGSIDINLSGEIKTS